MAYCLKIKVRYKNDLTSRTQLLPAILTEDGIVISHLRFLSSRSYKSESWKERSVFSLSLLINYLNAHQYYHDGIVDVLRSLAQSLQYGTIDSETLFDESGLYWNGRSAEDAKSILQHLNQYTDWLYAESRGQGKRANSFIRASGYDKKLNICALANRRDKLFLGHLQDDKEISSKSWYVRDVRSQQVPLSAQRLTKRFPDDKFWDLMNDGWRVKTSRGLAEKSDLDYKGRAISILLNKGGLRKSEVFQIYLEDIIIDPKSNDVIVRIYHPSLGKAPREGYVNRRDYLYRGFQMKPRTEYPRSHALHAGWKAPMLSNGTGKYFEVLFSPSKMSKVFLNEFMLYLEHQRVDPALGEEHPFAFTNNTGRPETMKNFRRLHKNAVEKIGLMYRKELGTTEHGHRHAYGFRLASLGHDKYFIQRAMHHANPDSCLVYIKPDDDDVRKRLRNDPDDD
jgi:hypothetical protein